jgi:hypothetical protein
MSHNEGKKIGNTAHCELRELRAGLNAMEKRKLSASTGNRIAILFSSPRRLTELPDA